MQVGRQRDINDIERFIGEHLAVVGIGRHTGELFTSAGATGFAVGGNRYQLCAWSGCDGSGVIGAKASEADKTKAHWRQRGFFHAAV